MPKQSLVYRFHSLREWTWLALKNLSRAGELLFSCSCQMLFSCLWQSNRKLPPHARKYILEHPLCSSMCWKQSQGVIGESRGPELGDPDATSFQTSMRLSLACLASFSLARLSPWNALATASPSSHHPDTERAYFKIIHWYFSRGGRACLDMVRPFLGTKDCPGVAGCVWRDDAFGSNRDCRASAGLRDPQPRSRSPERWGWQPVQLSFCRLQSSGAVTQLFEWLGCREGKLLLSFGVAFFLPVLPPLEMKANSCHRQGHTWLIFWKIRLGFLKEVGGACKGPGACSAWLNSRRVAERMAFGQEWINSDPKLILLILFLSTHPHPKRKTSYPPPNTRQTSRMQKGPSDGILDSLSPS